MSGTQYSTNNNCQNEWTKWNMDNVLLDTKGSCFLCLKRPSSNDDFSHSSARMTEACLRDICRYLKINPESLITSLKGGGGLGVKCDFSVLLCVTCAFLTRRLTDLIRRMEVIQMLMTSQLQDFHKSLKDSGQEEDSNFRWKNVKGNMIGDRSSPGDVRLVKLLRGLTREKCFLRIKQLRVDSHPKVMVEKLEYSTPPAGGMPIASEDTIQNLHPPSPLDEPSKSKPNSVFITRSGRTAGTIHSDNKSTSASTKLVSETFLRNYKIRQPGNQCQCLHCDYIGAKTSNIRQHLLNHHNDILFATAKHTSVSNSTFQYHCRKMLSVKTNESIIEANKRKKFIPSSRKRSFCFCSFCNRYLTNGNSFRYHLVWEHYSWCKEELIRLQESAPVISKSESCRINRKKDYMCNTFDGGCGRAFPSLYILRVHRRKQCLWTCTNRVGIGGCGKKFVAKMSLVIHRSGNCCMEGTKYNWASEPILQTSEETTRLHSCVEGPSNYGDFATSNNCGLDETTTSDMEEDALEPWRSEDHDDLDNMQEDNEDVKVPNTETGSASHDILLECDFEMKANVSFAMNPNEYIFPHL